MEWCEHMIRYDMTLWKWEGQCFQFCPICGTPKPKVKTLEEKMGEYIAINHLYLNGGNDVSNLANIVRTHFKEGGV